jgi:cytochrome P450
MWFLVAVASLLFVAYLLFSKRQRKFWFASPSGSVPILGHAPAFADMKKLHHQFCTWSKEMGGKNFEISLLGQRVVVLDDIDTMLHVWKDRTVRPDKIGAGALFSDAMESVWPPHHRLNLVSSTGDDHRRLRKILGVCFSPLSIRRSQEAINTMTERLLHSYEELRGSSSSLELDHVEFAKQLNMLTLDVIYAICFGRDPRPFLEKVRKCGRGGFFVLLIKHAKGSRAGKGVSWNDGSIWKTSHFGTATVAVRDPVWSN